MIRVLIAEDEPPTLRRLKRLIETTDPTFAVACTVGDGGQALEAMRADAYDVVFTDIRMPVMDGLDLMDTLHAQYPDCLVVAVSGFQDFAYVAHAVRAQIMDYILKPVSQEAMEELLGRLKVAHARVRQARLTRSLSAQLGRAPSRSQQTLPAHHESLGICVCCAGPMPFQEDAQMYPGEVVWEQASPGALLEDILPEGFGFSWAFSGYTPVEQIFIYETSAPGQAMEIAGRLYAEIAAMTDLPITCAATETGVALRETGKTIRCLRQTLRGSVRIGQGALIAVQPEMGPVRAPASRDVPQEVIERLSLLLRAGKLGPQASLWQETARRIEAEQWTQQQVITLLMSVVARLEADASIAAQARPLREVVMELLCTVLSLDELAQGLMGLGLEEEQTQGTRPQGIAVEVEAYLRAHYQEHLNNQTLAQVFSYVPSYISLLFRKAYEMSPSEYLTMIRLEEAKRLMRTDPDMLVREVAERVGFKSQHHFSRTFKKYEGMWPTSYQP